MLAIENIITENIDIWTTAIEKRSSTGRGSNGTVNLYGIQKLRELILELAVRGKLIPQDPNDEPASELLKKTKAEKNKLIKERKIKKTKPVPPLTKDILPHTIPNSWEWAYLPNLASYSPGKTPSTKNSLFWSDNEDGIPWVSIADMNHYGSINHTQKKITEEAKNIIFKSDAVPQGTILMSFKLTVGKISLLERDAFHNEAIISINPYTGVYRDYLFNVLPLSTKIGKTKKAIMGNTLNATSLAQLLIPLPPLEEQKRIVTKVDELMTLCDQLEEGTSHNLNTHQTLVKVLLNTLTKSQNLKELSENWARLEEHFDVLFTTEDSIEQLKQAILQLAVMGKLVPQDPNDEPASELVENIESEKSKLIKEGKIKKQGKLKPVTVKEESFKKPNGWEFVRLGAITNRIGSGSTPRGGKNAYVDNGIPFLRSQNIWNDGLKLSEVAFIPQETHEKMSNTKVFKGDILLNITGGSLGRSTIFPDNLDEANVSQHVTIIRPTKKKTAEYLHLCILSPYVQKMVWGRQVGMAREGLSKKVLELFEIPLPPLQEQKRIVAKVDELMALCDNLKSRINDAEVIQTQLADAITQKAVA